jgi:phage terminase large subunit-like protein
MAVNRLDEVEVPMDKLQLLYRLQQQQLELNRLIAINAPPRPRPWHQKARPNQLPPEGDWSTWLILAGRGFGKTRLGAEWLAEQAARNPGTEWAVVSPTWRDCGKVCIEGPSGLVQALLPGELESKNASDLIVRLTNGSKIYGYSADRPDRLRGTNLSGAWIDEAAAMQHADQLFNEALLPALRIGDNPRMLITTTPRPLEFLKKMIKRFEDNDPSIVVVRGSTWDNAANLSRVALANLRATHEGTRLGRQELEGELLDDILGALWNREVLDDTRVDIAPQMARIVVGVDPAVTSGEKADSTGIVVAGRSVDGHFYILEDLTCRGTPRYCMSRAVNAFHRWHADRIIGEVNNGGDYIEQVVRTVDPNVAYRSVRATRGKLVRAEPVAALWEQSRGHIVGSLPALEDQMCTFTTDSQTSPDNLDAAVWACTELNMGTSALAYLSAISKMCDKCELPNNRRASHCKNCGAQLPEAA